MELQSGAEIAAQCMTLKYKVSCTPAAKVLTGLSEVLSSDSDSRQMRLSDSDLQLY